MTHEMTASGLENLKIQLADIKKRLKDVAERIREARDLGDLSENSEYIEAKNDQAFLLGREADLEEKIKRARVVNSCQGGVVGVGCDVEVENGYGKMNFHIVGPDESNPTAGLISPDSPVGAALYGKKQGEKVQVKTPAGVAEYKIVKVN